MDTLGKLPRGQRRKPLGERQGGRGYAALGRRGGVSRSRATDEATAGRGARERLSESPTDEVAAGSGLGRSGTGLRGRFGRCWPLQRPALQRTGAGNRRACLHV